MEAIKKLFEPDGYFVTKFKDLSVSTWIAIGALIILAVIFIVVGKANKGKKIFDTKILVTGALCLATAFVLSYIRVIDLPQGGSVTLFSMLPLIIFSYMYGAVPGLIVCFAYSMLQVLQGAYIVAPVQFLLDYPLAFTLIGLSGLFRNNIVLGTVTAYVLRYICHFLSGVVFFGEYAAEAGFASPVVYSIFYNSFALLEMVLCLVVLAIAPVRRMLNDMRRQYVRT